MSSSTPSRSTATGEAQRTPSSHKHHKTSKSSKPSETAEKKNGLIFRKDGSTNWAGVLLVGSTLVAVGVWWYTTYQRNSVERDQRRRMKIMRDNLDQIANPPGGIQRMAVKNS
jgi:hypothetical protein